VRHGRSDNPTIRPVEHVFERIRMTVVGLFRGTKLLYHSVLVGLLMRFKVALFVCRHRSW